MMFDKYSRVPRVVRCDDTYRYVMRQLERIALSLTTGRDLVSGAPVVYKDVDALIDSYGTHLIGQIRKLNESGTLALLRLPLA